MRKIYQQRKSLGLCVDCGKVSENNKIYCTDCRIRHLASNANKVHRRKFKNQCSDCGESKEQDKARCDACLKYMENFMSNRRKIRELNNLCVDCGDNINIIGDKIIGNNKHIKPKRCDTCYLKIVSTNVFGTTKKHIELLELFHNQNGRCNYTNRIITLQIDCEIDHIIPRAKNGQNEINNLQWLHRDVNKMKHDLTESDFFCINERTS